MLTVDSCRKLALKYHPDRNPGDAAAEEKVIFIKFESCTKLSCSLKHYLMLMKCSRTPNKGRFMTSMAKKA